jgi:hypothetical protein
MMAGRNVSATHIAFGAIRVMATCAVMGQAAGTAAYLCDNYRTTPRGVYEEHISELQQTLLKDDCYIVSMRNEDPGDLARESRASASSWLGDQYVPDNVTSGVARPEDGEMNMWASDPVKGLPQHIGLEFGEPVEINTVYLTFDTNLDKKTNDTHAPECVSDYELSAFSGGKWRTLAEVSGNYHRRGIHSFSPLRVERLRLRIAKTNGDKSARVYEIRCYNES